MRYFIRNTPTLNSLPRLTTVASHTSDMVSSSYVQMARLWKCAIPVVFILFVSFVLFGGRNGERCVVDDTRISSTASVDFRVLVLTFSRTDSLRTCLERLDELIVDDYDTAALDIWIDRDKKDNRLDGDTYRLAAEFRWKVGPSSVHVHDRHVGVYGQWLDTWKPSSSGGNQEIALFVEDDVDISPYAYRWLKKVHAFYGQREDIGMYCLQDINAVRQDEKGHQVNTYISYS